MDTYESAWLISLGYGLITTVVMIMNFALIAILFAKVFNSDEYTVGTALFASIWNIITIAFANWLFFRFGSFHVDGSRSLLYFLGVTLAVGIFPVVVLLFWFERIYFMRHTKIATSISERINSLPQKLCDTEIILFGMGKKDKLKLRTSNLICVKSEGNYVSVYRWTGETTKREIIRASLKRIEDQFSNYPQFIRCHQSYIINKQFIDSISGNARGYVLHLKYTDMKALVSRQFDVSRLSQT